MARASRASPRREPVETATVIDEAQDMVYGGSMDFALIKAIGLGLLRAAGVGAGVGLIFLAVYKANSNAVIITTGAGLIAWATGGSVADKFKVAEKIQTALNTPVPETTTHG